ncbi:MAG: SDR family NAD(P)-dependent oxidoreductase [Novosphingobium sp.]|nr:SDR family NAD(P)-dependent oxidoreductase [Novosphingobium sp.]
MELEGKVAIVTGASSGIGRAYALAMAGQGATVIALARTLGRTGDRGPTPDSLAETVEAGRDLPGRILAQVCDVGEEAQLVNTIDAAGANFGRIDILVNNAAAMRQHKTFEIDGEEFDRMMRINVRAPYVAIRQVAALMIAQKAGSIVNITARAGNFIAREDGAHPDLLPYGVSKAALNRLSHFMAEELKPHGIAVNALSPGVVKTGANRDNPNFPGKEATAEVLGPALIYLTLQGGDGLTGQILHTDEFGQSWGAG